MKHFTLSLMLALFVPVLPGLVDSDSPLPVYSGVWLTDETITYAIGGSARYTNDNTATISFDVYTDGFTLFFLYTPGGGDVDMCIDGDCVTVSTDGTASMGRADFTDLAAGLKNVTVEVTTTPFYFDALYVFPLPEDVSSVSSTFTTTGGTEYTSEYHFSFTAGEVATVVLLAMLIIVQVSNLVMWLWHRQ